MAEVSQPRRSRRFSFSSRRPQSAVVTEEIKSQPPTTTIGFPIDALPLYSEAQQERPTSSWRNAFRRSQSVDRTNSRAPSSDRRSSRRLVKKQPGNGSRRDASVSSQTPTLPDVPLLSNMTTRIHSRRGSVSNNARDEHVVPYTNQQTAPSQQYGYDRIRSNTTTNAQREQQKNDHAVMKDLPPAPATPTLRRVGSPFYHTAAEKSAMSFNHPATTVSVEQRQGSMDTTRDDSMIPASLRVGRSKMESEGRTRDRASSPMQENPSYHSLPSYSPSEVAAQQANYDSITSLMEAVTFSETSNAPEQTSGHSPDAVESANKRDERIKNLRPLKTMSPRPHHAKTPSSSSSSSYGSSTFSALGEPATPVSSNASTTNFETTSISTKSNTSKKEIPRNTMSPKHDKYLAKIFVVCCHCNYWHDVPSGMYAQMVIPECLLFSGLPEPSSSRSSRSSSQARSAKSSGSKPQSIFSETSSSSGPSSSTKATVKCSWCKHEMAKSCCASWTTMVHLIEKHH